MYYNDQQEEDQMRMDMDMGMGMGMGMGGVSGSDLLLANDILKAIIGEVHAYNFYSRLAEMAPNMQDRQIILRIQQDEARHYHWFTMMLHMMGIPEPQIPPQEMPMDFEKGVRKAINNELETAAFYQDIAYRASSRPVQMHFMHATHDEQRHASLFQYMLMDLYRRY